MGRVTDSTGTRRRSEQLAADLLDLIRDEVIQPGTRLPTEQALCARFDVSRTVVREAMARLRAEGIVRTSHGRGTFVLAIPSRPAQVPPPSDQQGVLELLEFRTGVEAEASGLAARRRTASQLSKIADALRDPAELTVPATAVEADLHFHLQVAKASGNPHFVAMLESLGPGAIIVPTTRLEREPGQLISAWAEHRTILHAIKDRDSVSAAAAMRTHLVNSAQRLRGGQ